MKKYWFAILKNGRTVYEYNTNWDTIKNDVKQLFFQNGEQVIALPPEYSYIQAKTASASLSRNLVQIESRYIAIKLGNNIVRIRVNEKNDNITVEVE